MALTANQLRKQVDLPVWEWLRFSPVTPTSGLSASCVGDVSELNENNGRYIYYLLNATNFWRYDTISDTYQQLATPINAPLTASSLRFNGAHGYYNKVISATSTTLASGLPFGGSAIGYKIRIVSGRGAGQERIITDVSDPIVVDYGAATAGSTTSLTDTAKFWTSGYTGATANVNNYVGYVVRTIFGTGLNQVRKILYNSSTVLTIGDLNFIANDVFASAVWTAPVAGTVYQIEFSNITVDSAWDVTPDSTSRFVIQSGGIYLLSGASATPFYTLQYYDVLHDMWYVRSATTNLMTAAPTDVCVERVTENSVIFWQNKAASGSTTTLVDNTANWTTNQWAGYPLYIFSGSGKGQIAIITSNTSTTLTFPTQAVAIDSSSYFQIIGYEGGKSSGSNTFNTFIDSSKSWTVNRYANYGVRILFGTGAGQQRQILSNTSTALTIYGRWNIVPDNTSVYVIQGYSDVLYIGWGGSSQIYLHNLTNDMLTHGRVYETGVACIAAALPSDVSHNIYEQTPVAISSIAGTTSPLVTTAQAHNFRVGQYVSIRGVTSSATDQYNVTGLYQIANVPSTTTFGYVAAGTGSGTYSFLSALTTSNIADASKEYRDLASSGTNTSITFSRATPSNINGWYVSGTNVTAGAQVLSGAGTTTINLTTGAAVPSGVIIFNQYGPLATITSTFSTGGGFGNANVSVTSATSSNIAGWLAINSGIAVASTVTGGQGSVTLNLSNACYGAGVAGAITFYPPIASTRIVVMNTAAPAVTTGLQAGQLMFANTSGQGGATFGFITTLGTAPTAAITRYSICDTKLLGAALDQTITTYNSGVATTGNTTTLNDSSTVWASATGTGSAQGTTITLSLPSPGSANGWYVFGTGVNQGAQIIGGAGTTTITVSVPHASTVSGTITCTAWNNSLTGRRIKIQSGATGSPQELAITVIAPTLGNITFGAATAPIGNVAVYSLLSIPVHGAGHECQLATNNSVAANRGKYLWMVRGGGVVGIDKLDITTDRVVPTYLMPFAETLTTGSMFAYDGQDRLYFTKDLTQRVYYLDLNTNVIHGAGLYPYLAPTTGIGNKMEIFTTTDGLKYMWINRQQNQEHFRQLLFY